MVLTIVMLVLLAGSMVKISKAGIIGIVSYNRAKGELTYGNEVVVDFSNEQYDASEYILTTLINPEGFKMEDNSLVFTADNYNKDKDNMLSFYEGKITFNEDGEIISQTYTEYYNNAEKEQVRITEIDKAENIKVRIETLDDDGKKDTFDLSEEQMKLYEFLPTGIPLNEYIKAEEEETKKSNTAKDATGNIEVEVETKDVKEPSVSTDVESAKKPHLVVPSDEINDAVVKEIGSVKIFNNQISFEGNTLTYTTKDANGNLIDVAIVYNKEGITESTTKSYEGNIIYFREGNENNKELTINYNLGIKTIDYEEGNYIATISDGSKGKLESGNKFIYDADEGVTRTLEALNGGGTLKFYNKNPKDGEEEIGTITITRGSEKLTFYGTFDGKEVKEKGKKVLAIDENGNILTDFDKNGEAQTTYYAHSVFSAYVFGKKQSDKSEKIYWPGYEPFAFRTSDGEVILIQRQEDGSYKYYAYENKQLKELKEGDANFKEVNAMVRKTKIGPAFYAAASAARGGRALSNLLNSWLDIDFINKWRKKSDEFFSQTVIGRIISGKWEESLCHSKIEKIPENIAVVNVNNVMGFAAHVEGERSAAITTNNQTLYFYKITFGVNPSNVGDVTFNLLIDDHAVDFDNDGMADKIKLKSDETYNGTGKNAIVRYKPKIYKKVCLKFYNTENLNAEFRNSLKDNKLCNKINEVDLSSVEISEPASSTAVSSTSTGLPGW